MTSFFASHRKLCANLRKIKGAPHGCKSCSKHIYNLVSIHQYIGNKRDLSKAQLLIWLPQLGIVQEGAFWPIFVQINTATGFESIFDIF